MALFRRSQPDNVETVLRADARYVTEADGIRSLHRFSAGPHYDPDNLGFGALVGLDEHELAPGAGFAAHPHRGVEIISWVLEGALRHEDDSGTVTIVEPGRLLHQRAGTGLTHTEANASATEPLRFLQLTLTSDAGGPAVTVTAPRLLVPGLGLLTVLTGRTELELRSAFLHAARGSFSLTGNALEPGDSAELTGTATIDGEGELLVWAPLTDAATPA